MTNQFLNAQVYANSMLLLLKNTLVFGRLVSGEFKDQVTDQNGLTVNVKRPPRFIAGSGATLDTQDIVTGTAPVTVDQYKHVHIGIGDLEYVQSFNALMQNETMKSAASTLAHDVDKFIAAKTNLFYSFIAGTAAGIRSANASDATKLIASPSMAMAAYTRLKANGVPDGDLKGTLTYDDAQSISGTMLGQFLPGDNNMNALQRNRIPVIGNVDWYATQQLPTITTGTRTTGDGSSSGGQVNGASQNVNYRDVKGTAGVKGMTQSLILDGVGNSTTIKAGEVFTIQNCFAWDWRNQAALADLQQFTVLADATADGSGNVTLSISPAIIVQGTADTVDTKTNSAFGTVSAAPADNAYIKFVNAASTAMTTRAAFHKSAIKLVSAKLQMPFSGTASFATDPDTGIAIRYWRGSDITSGVHVHRWDMIYGGDVLDPSLGARVCGT